MWSEITFDKPKDKIYLLSNRTLNRKLEEIKNINKTVKVFETKVHDELGNQEFLICKEKRGINKKYSHRN